jgi:hypothetical protein
MFFLNKFFKIYNLREILLVAFSNMYFYPVERQGEETGISEGCRANIGGG